MKMYVVVRDDLTPSQKAVQAGHALAQYLKEHETEWSNGTLVYLKVKNKLDLSDLMIILDKHEMKHSKFIEPDLNNEPTALASIEGKKFFRNLELL